MQDIEAERLPAVTWATPRFELSDHPPFSTAHAHNWVTEIVNAVMRSDMWEHTAIFLTWDEWGGFYDPVLAAAGRPRGPRHARARCSPSRRTCSAACSTTSRVSSRAPLKFISDNWGLPYLTDRIEDTHAFEHVFDFSKRPRDPVLGDLRAPTFNDDPFEWVGDTYTGWAPGTEPVDKPL